MRSDKLHLPGDLVREQIIIRIEVLHPLPARQLKQAITRTITAPVRTSFPTNATIVLPDDVEAAVRRSIVNDDNLVLGPPLLQGAFDRLGNPPLGVVAGDQD